MRARRAAGPATAVALELAAPSPAGELDGRGWAVEGHGARQRIEMNVSVG